MVFHIKQILLSPMLLVLFAPLANSTVRSRDQAQQIVQKTEKELSAISERLDRYGLKTNVLLQAWADYERLSPNRDSLSPADKKTLQTAESNISPIVQSLTIKDGDWIKIRDQINKDIERLSQLSQEVQEAQEYLKGQNKEISPKDAPLAGNLAESRENIQEQQIEALETSAELDKIEAKYDKARLSAYFASKLAQFMNSNSFCKAKNHCSNRDTENPVDPDILYQELFPEMPANWRRAGAQETYDKVHKKGARPSRPRETSSEGTETAAPQESQHTQ